MRTVKEISDLTGISVRTLHYYDEIGLLKPSGKSEAGYRLYDDKALETLQQILFFREFDIPLKEIKTVIDDPALDRNRLLKMQRKMLAAKKERLERMIASIDEILKGENKMDFAVFDKSELEEMSRSMIERMPDNVRESLVRDFGSVEAWRKHYIERASRPDVQAGYRKVIEWYGDKETYLDYVNNPPSMELIKACENRTNRIMRDLAEKREQGCPVDSFEVKELIGEYGFVIRQLYQIKDEKIFMTEFLRKNYKNPQVRSACEEKYGAGMADYFIKAIDSFYRK